MLAQNFKTASDLGLTEKQLAALVATLGMLERGELAYFDRHRDSSRGESSALPSYFNMSDWSARYRCGTVCCIGGAAQAIGKLTRWELPDAALSMEGLNDLFYAFSTPTSLNDITVEHAASALRNYLTHGEPRWAEVLS